tara:strand:- start:461 stop:916 length:456 start_codon:yes stop_codon:yes gene_type:complete
MNLYIRSRINYLLLIIIICFLDQISKFYINLYISKLLNKDLLLFTIDFVKNYGAAFNIFSGSKLFLSFVSIISSIILSYLIFINKNKIIDKYALSFILAGSIGNGLDRIYKGYVIDFIKIKFIDFPVFNIADIAINIGVIILIISYFKVKN